MPTFMLAVCKYFSVSLFPRLVNYISGNSLGVEGPIGTFRLQEKRFVWNVILEVLRSLFFSQSLQKFIARKNMHKLSVPSIKILFHRRVPCKYAWQCSMLLRHFIDNISVLRLWALTLRTFDTACALNTLLLDGIMLWWFLLMCFFCVSGIWLFQTEEPGPLLTCGFLFSESCFMLLYVCLL